MSAIPVNVNWNGKKYEVEVDTDDTGLVFKTQLYTMTGVEPARQKILMKGGILKDDTNLREFNLKAGTSIMMMGTAGELPKAPLKPTQFVETMTDRELADALKLPAGLTNLGNTCYMNSTLQCLRAIPELQDTLNRQAIHSGKIFNNFILYLFYYQFFSFSGNNAASDSQGNLTASLRDLYRQLNQTTEEFAPFEFLQMLRAAFPQFAQRDNRGYLQQDAKECWTEIVSSLNARLKIPQKLENVADTNLAGGAYLNDESFVRRFMTGEYTTTFTCDEAPEEETVVTKDPFTELDCHITTGQFYAKWHHGGMKTDRKLVEFILFNNLVIFQTLDTKVQKNSPTLNREAIYTKRQRVSRLPAYLTVQFVRFSWKPQEQVRAKILRKVKFPFILDATPLCTEELSSKVSPIKNKLLEFEKNREAAKNKAKLSLNPAETAEAEETVDPKLIDEIKSLVDPELAKDIGANLTGLYELCAVLTHKGRRADSGILHNYDYLLQDITLDGYAEKKLVGKLIHGLIQMRYYLHSILVLTLIEEWVKYNDDEVSAVTQDEIEKLSGGGESKSFQVVFQLFVSKPKKNIVILGDWHTAYILLYRSKNLP
ncbi:hypothetical protein G9A89_011088 [Geosiphon pyriformis]|nr:hypothetical protein G9A89_011088 [Geosiphon pyriformis]